MIFGTFQQCFVLNTSLNSILNKFFTPVVLPNDKINYSVFNAKIKQDHCIQMPITTLICTIFGTIEHRDILNVPVISFSSTS